MRNCRRQASEASRILRAQIRLAALRLQSAFSADGKAAQPRTGRRRNRLREARRSRGRELHGAGSRAGFRRAHGNVFASARRLRREGQRRHHHSGNAFDGEDEFQFRRRTADGASALRHVGKLRSEHLPAFRAQIDLADAQSDDRRELFDGESERTQRNADQPRRASHRFHRHAGAHRRTRLLARRRAYDRFPPSARRRRSRSRNAGENRARNRPRAGAAQRVDALGRRLRAERHDGKRRHVRAPRPERHPPLFLHLQRRSRRRRFGTRRADDDFQRERGRRAGTPARRGDDRGLSGKNPLRKNPRAAGKNTLLLRTHSARRSFRRFSKRSTEICCAPSFRSFRTRRKRPITA